ncbi:MAG: hypothetical protein JSV25_03970 [Spirochaetota bacterium]|nr:MAG: hypothetical protein JSV25_03970 [Spirochaetota bacterium]
MQSVEKLDLKLKQYNAQYRIVSSNHLSELQEEIEDLNRKGKINPEIYNSNITTFQYTLPDSNNSTRSLIVIAIPQKISIVVFKLNGKNVKTIIPPTYLFSKVRRKCIGILSEVFGNKIEIIRAMLPLKLLAARSGLGRYGRNHLCYVDDMGSFTRLEAFFIQYETDRDDWQHKEMLQNCENCNKCVLNCPTQCIKNKEFNNKVLIIEAGRCITHYNENEGAFPPELHTGAHTALVGCIKCQVVCPVNHPYLKEKAIIETFTEEETDLILENKLDASEAISDKLKNMDMDEYQPVFSRNLKALIQHK